MVLNNPLNTHKYHKSHLYTRPVSYTHLDVYKRQDHGWDWNLWKRTLLPFLSFRVCPGLHQDGKRAESVLKSDKDFRCLWTPDVLSEK